MDERSAITESNDVILAALARQTELLQDIAETLRRIEQQISY